MVRYESHLQHSPSRVGVHCGLGFPVVSVTTLKYAWRSYPEPLDTRPDLPGVDPFVTRRVWFDNQNFATEAHIGRITSGYLPRLKKVPEDVFVDGPDEGDDLIVGRLVHGCRGVGESVPVKAETVELPLGG